MQSYSVRAIEPTATHPEVSYGGDLFIVYEPDPASTDPPITGDLQWIQVTYSLGRSFVDGDVWGRANPYYFGSGLTSVDGKQLVAKARQPALAHAQCMRKHGVPNFPDPTVSSNGGAIVQRSGGEGLNPRSPAFQQAQKLCGRASG